MNVNATGVARGDTIQRSFDLLNQGTLNHSSITLTTPATTSSLLDTDATNGLQLVIDRCQATWTESGTSPAFSDTCSGSTSMASPTARRRVEPRSLANLSALNARGVTHAGENAA